MNAVRPENILPGSTFRLGFTVLAVGMLTTSQPERMYCVRLEPLFSAPKARFFKIMLRPRDCKSGIEIFTAYLPIRIDIKSPNLSDTCIDIRL